VWSAINWWPQPFSRFIEHDSQDSFYRHRRAAFSSGKPGTCELVLRRADRTGLPVHLESLPVTGDAARIRQCRIALVDVTELKRTEAALREARDSLEEKVRLRTAALDAANEQLEHLLGSSPAIIYSSKPSGDYAGVFISKNVREQLGYEAQEFMEDPGFWAGHIHPEDKPAVFARLAAISKQGRLSLEYRFRHKDGTYRWMRDDVTLVKNSAGRPQQIVGCWMDVTERRQAEEGRAQLAAIVESSEDAIISGRWTTHYQLEPWGRTAFGLVGRRDRGPFLFAAGSTGVRGGLATHSAANPSRRRRGVL
jgi:PAS domain S-box-containing protein